MKPSLIGYWSPIIISACKTSPILEMNWKIIRSKTIIENGITELRDTLICSGILNVSVIMPVDFGKAEFAERIYLIN